MDKTKILYDLLQFPIAAVIIGPRRCGKTLTLSTIATLFSQSKQWWEKNCSNLYIFKKHPDFFENNPHPIMKFNFYEVNSLDQYQRNIEIDLKNIIFDNDINYNIPENASGDDMIKTHLSGVILALRKKFKKNPIVLVDESDHPLINIMQDRSISQDEKQIKMEDLLKAYKCFYGILKKLLVDDLRGLAICGHSMISQTAIFSGI